MPIVYAIVLVIGLLEVAALAYFVATVLTAPLLDDQLRPVPRRRLLRRRHAEIGALGVHE